MIYKLNNVTSLTSARWAAAEGFSIISFNFDKHSLGYIKPMQVAEICKWISGIKVYGNFNKVEVSVIEDLFYLLKLDAIEVDLETAQKLNVSLKIPILLSLEPDNYLLAIEFAKYYDPVIAFSTSSKLKITKDIPYKNCFFNADLQYFKDFYRAYGIEFDEPPESEIGYFDFEILEKLKMKWTQHEL